MNTKEKKTREKKVLEIVIQTYIPTGAPVSSRYVSRKLDLSSATIRNVMADLEESGLINHPHTSAGRIPTDKGYRFYVDSLMRLKQVTCRQIRDIEAEYHSRMKTLEDILEKTAQTLSRFTNYAGVTFFPKKEGLRRRIYLGSVRHILEYPEFRDYNKLINILRFFEEEESISSILSEDLYKDGVRIHIGSENRPFGLEDLSVVTAGFKMRNEALGRLGVIGPMRMDYDRVVPIVDVLANTVTRILS